MMAWIRRRFAPRVKPGDWVEIIQAGYNSDGERIFSFPFERVREVNSDGSIWLEDGETMTDQGPAYKIRLLPVQPQHYRTLR